MILSIPEFRSVKEQPQLLVLALFAGLGILYLAPKMLPILNVGPNDYFDFRIFWLAGKIWASGQNPYDGASFPEYSSAPNRAPLSPWFYPPYWYPLIVPFGLLPFKIALSLWKAINFSLLVGANYLVARALADVTHQKCMPIFLAGTGFVCLMHGTAIAAWGGQTSILVFFGLAAMIFGLLRARPLVLIVGLVFLALKPQIGVMAFAAVAALHRYRWTVLPAAAICLFASTTIAITGDYRASVEGFFANILRHSEHSANIPQILTGLIHILDFLFSTPAISLISLIALLASTICVVIALYNSPLNKTSEIKDRQQTVASLALFVGFMHFFIPLHNYDMVALVALLMMIIAIPLAGRWLIALGLLICFRPDYLWRAISAPSRIFSSPEPLEIYQSHLVSLGLFLIVVGAAWSFLISRSQARVWPNSVA